MTYLTYQRVIRASTWETVGVQTAALTIIALECGLIPARFVRTGKLWKLEREQKKPIAVGVSVMCIRNGKN